MILTQKSLFLQKVVYHFVLFVIFFLLFVSLATAACDPQSLEKNPQTVLGCYIQDKAKGFNPTWALEEESQSGNINIFQYRLDSLFWPQKNISDKGTVWQHQVKVYQPKKLNSANSHQALLIINGGTNHPLNETKVSQSRNMDALAIAQASRSYVIEMSYAPNQYLAFDDGIERKEDDLVAYTWNRYLNDPSQAYWSVHLPMAKAAVVTMDKVQALAKKKGWKVPQNFVVTGASKRGWAAWLVALADKRVNGLIPIVIDILDTKANLEHIYQSFKGWPPAFNDYVSQGITTRIDSPEFSQLMQIEDPLTYDDNSAYRQRLAIPKYIISAAGDDFFAADSLSLYLDKLPGVNTLRAMPNQSHYIDMALVTQEVINFYGELIQGISPPVLSWTLNKQGRLNTVNTHQAPKKVRLWQAYNPTLRDFRVNAGIVFTATSLSGECDKKSCQFKVANVTQPKGYWARFVEMSFATPSGDITVTTPIIVSGKAWVVGEDLTELLKNAKLKPKVEIIQ
ncbi:PhoPQ-activated protein PqaA family protein [Shewanella surugensis]|uniref:PhoPQ-activated pathogenicity-related family protein n=1 Tax=Shewanella surugensis TaxID=212020 RepID=A0ABT0LDR7_9GAMM|nr:PhoPQ-activated protein PqaA family protein [Shewanella surugensis]MCL1125834.1 PhoPQ-activated pathogenicity-related family protein [Shewanella surugensis]